MLGSHSWALDHTGPLASRLSTVSFKAILPLLLCLAQLKCLVHGEGFLGASFQAQPSPTFFSIGRQLCLRLYSHSLSMTYASFSPAGLFFHVKGSGLEWGGSLGWEDLCGTAEASSPNSKAQTAPLSISVSHVVFHLILSSTFLAADEEMEPPPCSEACPRHIGERQIGTHIF